MDDETPAYQLETIDLNHELSSQDFASSSISIDGMVPFGVLFLPKN
jgi:hypothetical protein